MSRILQGTNYEINHEPYTEPDNHVSSPIMSVHMEYIY